MTKSPSKHINRTSAPTSEQPDTGSSGPKKVHEHRLQFLDSVRAIAALLVLTEHSLEAAGVISLAPGGFGIEILDFGQAGVMAFFLVSGFIIPVSLERKRSPPSFWISRLLRLYPMYIVAWIFGALIVFQLNFLGYLQNLAYHLLFIQEVAVKTQINIVPGSWTLEMEMVWYIFFSLLFVLGLNGATERIVLAAVTIVLALLVISVVTHKSLPFGRAGLFLGFLAGLTVYRHHSGAVSSLKAFWLVTLITATSILAAYIRFKYLVNSERHLEFSSAAIITSWGLGYAVFLTAYFASSRPHAFFAILSPIGAISYSLYLCHPFFVLLGNTLHIEGWLLLPFVLVTSVGASVVTHRYIEQPFVKLGHRIIAMSAARGLISM